MEMEIQDTGTVEAAQENTTSGTRVTPLLNDQDNGYGHKEQNSPDNAEKGSTQDGSTQEDAPKEQYTADDYTIDTPEGMTVNTELMGEFKSLAAELNLSPKAAQKLMDLEVKNAQLSYERHVATIRSWEDEITKDPEFGGHRLEETKNHALRALKAYDESQTLLTELTQSGFGSHPGIIRFLARVGKELPEDTIHTGREASRDRRPLRDRLWPDHIMPH